MIIDRDNNITLITQERTTIPALVKLMQKKYDSYKNDNVIVNLSSIKKLLIEDIIEFLEISNNHRASKRSFVIVSNNTNLSESPDEIIVVPTIQEAYDIIEMEEIERDLGF